MSADLCSQLADLSRWDAWLDAGLPEALRAHAQRCERCASALADFDRMHEGLAQAQEDTFAAAAPIDLVGDVMGQLDEAKPRRVPLAMAAGLLIVAISAGALVLLRGQDRVQLIAPEGATLISSVGSQESRELIGRHELSRPFTLEANGGVMLLAKGLEINLAPRSRLTVDAEGLRLSRGRATLQAASEFFMTTTLAQIQGRGRIEVLSEGVMKPKKTMGAAAIAAAVAVYVGWAKVSTSEAEMRGEAPIRMTVDRDGQIASGPIVEPASQGVSASKMGTGRSATALSAKPGQPKEEAQPAGAFWSEDAKAMRFKIEGEVFDALSGKPVTDFEVRAAVDKAMDYASHSVVSDRFSSPEGKFAIAPLGLGRWRITVRAKGYAPLTQTIALNDVSANPYVVAPLSSGTKLSGQVVDFRRRPVEGAHVTLEGCKKEKDDLCQATKTGSDGRFLLEGLPAGETFAVNAHHKRHGYAVQRNLRPSRGRGRARGDRAERRLEDLWPGDKRPKERAGPRCGGARGRG